jgi:hypothetical protein
MRLPRLTHPLRPTRQTTRTPRAKTYGNMKTEIELRIENRIQDSGRQDASGLGTTCPPLPRAHISFNNNRRKRGHEFLINFQAPLRGVAAGVMRQAPLDIGPRSFDCFRVADDVRRQTPVSHAIARALRLSPFSAPAAFARKAVTLLRFVARNCALSLIFARNPAARLGTGLSRTRTQWHSPRTLTQGNPSLAQIFLSYGANFLSQSDRIRPNLSQRLFRQSIRPNLTHQPINLCPCPMAADFSAPMFLPRFPAPACSKQAYTRSDKAKQASKKMRKQALLTSLPRMSSLKSMWLNHFLFTPSINLENCPSFFLSGFSGSVTYHLNPKPVQKSNSRPSGPSIQKSETGLLTFTQVYTLLLTLLSSSGPQPTRTFSRSPALLNGCLCQACPCQNTPLPSIRPPPPEFDLAFRRIIPTLWAVY